MRSPRLQEARLVHELLRRRLERAEQGLHAASLRLMALDGAIGRLNAEGAQIAGAAEDLTGPLASIDTRRRAALSAILQLKAKRSDAEFEREERRAETQRLLRRKIALERAIDGMEGEARALARRR